MPLTEVTHKKALDFLEVIKIGSNIITKSEVVHVSTKEGFANHDNILINTINESIANKDLSAVGLKSLVDSYFIYWNESAGIDIEEFWAALAEKSFQYHRKDPLKYALDKGHFRNVHQAMSVRKDWERLQKSTLLKNRLTTEHIAQLDQIIQQDELKRVEVIKKYIAKKKIPKTQYLKFGDAIGYLSYCKLFEKYFSPSEYEELNEIWKNFTSR
jgi:hypothetical protein